MKNIVTVLVYPGCITYEVALAAELTSDSYQIVVASPDGLTPKGLSGLPIKVDCSFNDVAIKRVKGVLVPGGDPGSIVENKDVDKLVVLANNEGAVLGAICAGPLVLAKAGVLKGRKIAHGYEKEQLDFLAQFDYFGEVSLSDEQLIVDGPVVTAKPTAHIEFALEFAVQVGSVKPVHKQELIDYYRARN